MAQHNFEEEAARLLRDREISPQPESWQKLDSRLEKESKKSISIYWISGIAATITAAILVGSLVFNSNTMQSPAEVVEVPVEEVKIDPQQELLKPQLQQPNGGLATTGDNESEAVQQKKEPVLIGKISSEVAVTAQKFTNKKAGAGNPEPEAEITAGEDLSTSNGLQEVLANVSSRLQEGDEMDEAEIDALLYKAAAELSLERKRQSLADNQIDANALLMDVEMELDNTFRDKVFEILKEGYLKARTAVANRNF